ncbi:MAG: hypothetical protein ACRCSG_06095 [Cellulosilyticaceae bacterium]
MLFDNIIFSSNSKMEKTIKELEHHIECLFENYRNAWNDFCQVSDPNNTIPRLKKSIKENSIKDCLEEMDHNKNVIQHMITNLSEKINLTSLLQKNNYNLSAVQGDLVRNIIKYLPAGFATLGSIGAIVYSFKSVFSPKSLALLLKNNFSQELDEYVNNFTSALVISSKNNFSNYEVQYNNDICFINFKSRVMFESLMSKSLMSENINKLTPLSIISCAEDDMITHYSTYFDQISNLRAMDNTIGSHLLDDIFFDKTLAMETNFLNTLNNHITTANNTLPTIHSTSLLTSQADNATLIRRLIEHSPPNNTTMRIVLLGSSPNSLATAHIQSLYCPPHSTTITVGTISTASPKYGCSPDMSIILPLDDFYKYSVLRSYSLLDKSNVFHYLKSTKEETITALQNYINNMAFLKPKNPQLPSFNNSKSKFFWSSLIGVGIVIAITVLIDAIICCIEGSILHNQLSKKVNQLFSISTQLTKIMQKETADLIALTQNIKDGAVFLDKNTMLLIDKNTDKIVIINVHDLE